MSTPNFDAYRTDALTLTGAEIGLHKSFDTWLPPRIFDAHLHNALREHVGDIPTRGLGHMMSTFPWNSLEESRAIQEQLYGSRIVRGLRFSKTLPGVDYKSVNSWLREQTRTSGDLFGLFGLQEDIQYTIEALHAYKPDALKMYYFVTDPPGRRILDVFPAPVLRECEQLGIPIILHLPTPITECADELRAVREQFPSLQIVLAHLAMALYLRPGLEDAYRRAAALGVWLDTACMEHADVLDLALDTFGTERVMFGSDEPLNLVRAVPYVHPQKGPMVVPRMKHHWVVDEEWAVYGHLGQNAVHNHWQQLGAIRSVCDRNPAAPNLKNAIFWDNANRLFGFDSMA